MLTPKGQKPAPKIVPFCVLSNSNTPSQVSINCTRSMNAKAVVTSAMKHAQKSRRRAAGVRSDMMKFSGPEWVAGC